MEGDQNVPIEISSDSEDEDVLLVDWDVPLTKHKASGKQALVRSIICVSSLTINPKPKQRRTFSAFVLLRMLSLR